MSLCLESLTVHDDSKMIVGGKNVAYRLVGLDEVPCYLLYGAKYFSPFTGIEECY